MHLIMCSYITDCTLTMQMMKKQKKTWPCHWRIGVANWIRKSRLS